MFCDNCGNKLRDGAKFCDKCGQPVDDETELIQNEHTSYDDVQKTVPYDRKVASAFEEITSEFSQQNRQVNQYSRTDYYMPTQPYYSPGTHPYHSLGGFLAFIVVINFIAGALALVAIIPTLISYINLIKLSEWVERYAHGYKGLCVFGMIGALILLVFGASIMISFANRIRHQESDFLHYIQSKSITFMIISMVYLIVIIIWARSYDTYGVVSQFYGWKDLLSVFVPWLIGYILSCVYFGCSVRVRTYMGSDEYLRQSIFNKSSSPIPADGSDIHDKNISKKNDHGDSSQKWYCPKCDMLNPNGAITCVNCGTKKPRG